MARTKTQKTNKAEQEFMICHSKTELFARKKDYITILKCVDLKQGDIAAVKTMPTPVFSTGEVTQEWPCDAMARLTKEAKNSATVRAYSKISIRTLQLMFSDQLIPVNTVDDNGGLEFNNDLQRLESTDILWKSKYLVDFFMGVPTPEPTVVISKGKLASARPDTEHVNVNDGQQRLIAWKKFLNDEFAITGTNTHFDGKTFSQLPHNVRTAILEMSLALIVLDDEYDDDELTRINFYNINTTAHPLNAMETLNVVYPSLFADELKKCLGDDTHILHTLMYPNGKPAKGANRQKEERILTYAAALACNKNGKTQGDCIKSLREAIKTQREAEEKCVSLTRVAEVIVENLGPELVWKINADEKVTGLAMKNFTSVFYMASKLYDMSGKTNKRLRLHGDAVDVICETTNMAFEHPTYKAKKNGGAANLYRSKILLRAVVQNLLAKHPELIYDSPVGTKKMYVALQNLENSLKKEGVESIVGNV